MLFFSGCFNACGAWFSCVSLSYLSYSNACFARPCAAWIVESCTSFRSHPWFQQDQVYPKWHPPAWGGHANASPEEAWGRWAVARMWTLESTSSMCLYVFMILAYFSSLGKKIRKECLEGGARQGHNVQDMNSFFSSINMLPPFLGFCLVPPINSSSRFELFFCNAPSFWQLLLFSAVFYGFLFWCCFLVFLHGDTGIKPSRILSLCQEASAIIATWSTVSPTRSIRWRSEVAGTCQFCPRCKKLHCKLPGWSPWRRCQIIQIKVSINGGTPKSSIVNHCNTIFPYKPSIWG